MLTVGAFCLESDMLWLYIFHFPSYFYLLNKVLWSFFYLFILTLGQRLPTHAHQSQDCTPQFTPAYLHYFALPHFNSVIYLLCVYNVNCNFSFKASFFKCHLLIVVLFITLLHREIERTQISFMLHDAHVQHILTVFPMWKQHEKDNIVIFICRHLRRRELKSLRRTSMQRGWKSSTASRVGSLLTLLPPAGES